MAFTETLIETRANTWREADAERRTAPRSTQDAPSWSEADAIGAEAESWLSTLSDAGEAPEGRPDIDLADLPTAAPFRRRSTNTWREPLDEVRSRSLG